MRAALFAAVMTAAGAACVEPDVGERTDPVIGGTVTPDGMFPGVGALLYDLGQGLQVGCTGTLITPTVVMTAAHCVDPQLGGDVLAGFTMVHDTVDMTLESADVTPVARKVKHEQFNLNSELMPGLQHWFDIGLVFLAQPITDVEPVKLPRPDDRAGLTADSELQIVGYGRISNQTNDVGVMYDATTKLVSLNDFELQIASAGMPQNCNGDSGGPALIELGGRTRVVGIVSRSFDGQAGCANGGIDTRADAYLDWIVAQGVTDLPCGSATASPCADDDEGGCC